MKLRKVALMVILMVASFVFADAKQAPSFRLPNMKGKKVSLTSLLKKGPVLIDFWASWCTPCKEEMPIFNELYKKYKKDGLQMVLVSIDKSGGISTAKNYVKSKGYEFDVLFDKSGKIFKKYGGKSSVPVTYIVDKNQKVIFEHKGEGSKEIFETAIKNALKK